MHTRKHQLNVNYERSAYAFSLPTASDDKTLTKNIVTISINA